MALGVAGERATPSASTVSCLYDASLQLLYVLVDSNEANVVDDGRSTATTPATPTPTQQIYVPVRTSQSIDMIAMARVQRRLAEVHANLDAISLALIDASGITIYYRLTDGFKEKKKAVPKPDITDQEEDFMDKYR